MARARLEEDQRQQQQQQQQQQANVQKNVPQQQAQLPGQQRPINPQYDLLPKSKGSVCV
jgi:hypothetical protein